MVVYCSALQFLLEHGNLAELAEYYSRLCINIDSYPLVLIPDDKKLEKILKGANGSKEEEFEARKLALSFLIHANVYDDSFDSSKFYTNGLRQQVKIMKSVSGAGRTSKDSSKISFTVYSGSDFKTKAECNIHPDFEPPLSMNTKKGDGAIMGKLIATLNGDIAVNGNMKVDEKTKKKVEKMFGGAYNAYETKSKNDKLEKFNKLFTKAAANPKSNPFMACIAGLLVYVKDNISSSKDCHRAYQLIKTLSTHDALGLYLVLFQPYGDHQFISDEICCGWDGAEKSADSGSEYIRLFDNICSWCSCECCSKDSLESLRSQAKDELENLLTAKDRVLDIQKTYNDYCIKMFGDDFLNSAQKLWADEFLYMSHMTFENSCKNDNIVEGMNKIKDLAQSHYTGMNYGTESLFSDSKYWQDNADTRSVTRSEKFLESPFFLKCCFTDSEECKKYTESCCNPMSSKAKAYFMINGGKW